MLDHKKIASDFPILQRTLYDNKRLIYLDNASTSQKPKQVINSLVDYYENTNSNVHRGVHALSVEATDEYEQARHKVANFIGAPQSESIIWTRNTTEGINLVAQTWGQANISEGDEIVVTAMEHHSNLVPWQKVASDKKATLKIIPLNEDQTLDLTSLEELINPRTKLVSIVHMSNSIGTINPIEKISAQAKKVGAHLMIDGAQSVPHMPVDVEALNCDFLAFSGHKMLGPTGIGVLYVKKEVLETMDPFLRGGEMVLEVNYQSATWNDLPMKFEAGTPNIADAIALGAAIDYLTDIGMDNVHTHELELTKYALNQFNNLDEDLELLGPGDPHLRGGIFSFHHPTVHPHDLGTLLDRRGIAVRTGHHCTMPLIRELELSATARASFYIYNNEQDIDELFEGLKESLGYFLNAP
ncbi:MAG: aminotransferase class V-fold PLP-dependent enzyme [Dehalococcoidia bacterium]